MKINKAFQTPEMIERQRVSDALGRRAEFERDRVQPFLEALAALCNAHRVRLVDVSCGCCGGGEIEVRPLLDGEALGVENVIAWQS